MNLGTVRTGLGKARTGIFQGSLLLSTPGQLICLTRRSCKVSHYDPGQRHCEDSHAISLPHRWRSRSPVFPQTQSEPGETGPIGRGGSHAADALSALAGSVSVRSRLQRGRGARCAALVCPGCDPYCWYFIFKEQAQPHCPAAVLSVSDIRSFF